MAVLYVQPLKICSHCKLTGKIAIGLGSHESKSALIVICCGFAYEVILNGSFDNTELYFPLKIKKPVIGF